MPCRCLPILTRPGAHYVPEPLRQCESRQAVCGAGIGLENFGACSDILITDIHNQAGGGEVGLVAAGIDEHSLGLEHRAHRPACHDRATGTLLPESMGSGSRFHIGYNPDKILPDTCRGIRVPFVAPFPDSVHSDIVALHRRCASARSSPCNAPRPSR